MSENKQYKKATLVCGAVISSVEIDNFLSGDNGFMNTTMDTLRNTIVKALENEGRKIRSERSANLKLEIPTIEEDKIEEDEDPISKEEFLAIEINKMIREYKNGDEVKAILKQLLEK